LEELTLIRNILTLLPLSLVLSTVPATASVIFNNYPINGAIDGLAMSGVVGGTPISASDSFTLGSSAIANGVNFGVWIEPLTTFGRVNWTITSQPLGGGVLYGFGAGSPVSLTVIPDPSLGSTTLASATFSFPDLSLAAGTYYLTLQGTALWDINNAPGVDAWETGFGDLSAPGVCSEITQGAASGTCAESFQILDNNTPEPSSWVLLGSAIILAALTLGPAHRRLTCRRKAS
jgi:hypothetical protein